MMDEENQRDNPRLTEAKHAAKNLLRVARLSTAPITINRVIGAVNQTFSVTVRGVPGAMFGGKGDALTQARHNHIFIIYNDDKPVVRKRFSVAHELGHLYIGHLHGNSSIDLNSENFDELEANTFAAHLLMPPNLLRGDIRAGTKKPEDLAEKYQVSLDAMWMQLRNTSLFKLL